jgi:DNA-directed RNA polymerase III subunit RPC1
MAAKIMLRFSKLSARWITNYGMTIGAYDVAPSASLIIEKEEKMKQAYEKCDELI